MKTYNYGVLHGNEVYTTIFICIKLTENSPHSIEIKLGLKRLVTPLVWYPCGETI